MSAAKPILLILGSGANIGQGVARAFSAKGYRVAATSRSEKPKQEQVPAYAIDLHITSDLVDAGSILGVFEKVRQALGQAPSVVVYNAAALTFTPPDDPLALSVEDLNRDFQINTASVLEAAKQAVAGFSSLPSAAAKTFIYTGNRLTDGPLPGFVDLGIGKSGSAHLIAAASEAYAPKGFRFYFADQRAADGGKPNLDGAAHGEFYLELAEGKTNVPWLATFAASLGYRNFRN
ncbi:hypothetical protein LMH87_001952 [Akanthomyces muscarius]|uniref:Short-chain dehydrogenase n=1 Tax=Akanthomyces muscarius TaxID=2231603 RepID=A0A9W8Q662_AKAMU|nr:hypothetical protein LMH87_001952 [Akanthomyces muscarius]KAJ4147432.1 hypothetical protein LMH87_001952 [Akanthomyces muscarius]